MLTVIFVLLKEKSDHGTPLPSKCPEWLPIAPVKSILLALGAQGPLTLSCLCVGYQDPLGQPCRLFGVGRRWGWGKDQAGPKTPTVISNLSEKRKSGGLPWGSSG